MSYQHERQHIIKAAKLYRDGWSEEQKYDVTEIVSAIYLYEDMSQPSISAAIEFIDVFNIVDRMPIIGGELIDIRFEVPSVSGPINLTYVVNSISEKINDKSNQQMMLYKLNLVTLDRWVDSAVEISESFSGTYDQILTNVLSKLKTKRPITSDKSHLKQDFIVPFWSPLKTCVAITQRTMGSKFEPFFFWDTLGGYQFKSVKSIYSQKSHCKFIMGLARMEELQQGELSFRKVLSFDVNTSLDKISRENLDAFGTSIQVLDPVYCNSGVTNMNFEQLSQSKDFARVDSYPHIDRLGSNRAKMDFLLSRKDKSHEGVQYRNTIEALHNLYNINILVPGDPSLRAGQIVELDIHDFRADTKGSEAVTSGRWLVKSIKHTIKKVEKVYVCTLELVKDSHKIDLNKLLGSNGVRNNATQSKPTGIGFTG